ncbi:RHS repeat protein, partial [Streptomyces sp. NRRL F-2664]|uniref:RHS repeat protein n=1 Tax=Streptomyces sp. NRRL F-2664 TaxID=1463842 RepID=UPI00131DA660
MDVRTGRYALEVPLLDVAGRGGAGLGLVLSYDQELSGLGVDRYGFGAGMGLGLPFVDAAGGRALVCGGVFGIDAGGGSVSGLKRFPGEGVRFEHVPGSVLAGREGVGERGFEWRLADRRDGSVQYFDADGNPVAFADRHGNRVDFSFVPAGSGVWRLAAVTDSYGLVTEVAYSSGGSGQDQVVFRGPARSGDGRRLSAVLDLVDGQVRRVTGGDGGVTVLEYARPLSGHGPVVSRVTAPFGGVTEIGYEELPGSPVPALVASRLRLLDSGGVLAAPEQRLDVAVEEGRSFTGSGGDFAGEDDVFDQRTGYTYSTEVALLGVDGEPERRVVSHYNSLHLLTSQEVFTAALGDRVAGALERGYSWQGGGGSSAVPGAGQELPADWALPVRERRTVGNSAGQLREAVATAAYDSFGRVVRRSDETGTVTETGYDTHGAAVGLVLSERVTDREGRVLRESVNTPSGDRRTVAGTVEKAAGSDGRLAAREEVWFSYDAHGELASRTVRWAEGAGQEGRGRGPDELRTTVGRAVREGRLTETVTTAPGTAAETAASRTVDLATGAVLEETDPSGRVVVRFAYDEYGRPAGHTLLPDSGASQTTKVSYPSPTATVVCGPDGRCVTRTVDAFGRMVRTADNYRDGRYAEGAQGVRVLAEADYSQWAHYRVATTDRAGRKTVFQSDPWGHTGSVARPDGTVVKTAADVVAEAVVQGVLGKDQQGGGIGEARALTVQDHDSQARTMSGRVVFADGSPAAAATAQSDALGRLLASTSGEVTAVPFYGAGGVSRGMVLNPAAPEAYPGPELTASLTRDLAGRQTAKTLTQGEGDTHTAVENSYDAAGRLAVQTDQLGNTTAYTYTADGQVAEAVVETGDGKPVTRTAYTYASETGMLTSVSVTDAAGAATVRHLRYDRLNRITGIWEGGDEAAEEATLISYGYDGEGRLASVAYPDGRTVSRAFDAAGQITSTTDAAGAVTAYAYNADGSLESAEHRAPDGQTSSAAYTYDSHGRVCRTAYGNGTVMAVEYFDSGQRRKEILTGKDGAVLSETAYTYNSRGDLATRTDTRPAPGAGGDSSSGRGSGTPVTTHTVHSYDAYGRLTATTVHSGTDSKAPALRTTAYTANAAGDVTTVTVTDADGTKTATEHHTDPSGRLTAITTSGTRAEQAWDAAGNLTQGADGTTWTYTPANKPLTATAKDGTRTEYAYWADGSRKNSTTTSPDGTTSTVLFHYTPDGAIANDTHTSTDGSRPPRTGTYLTTPSGGREARTLTAAPDAARYLHTDRRGNTVLETGPSAQTLTSRAYTDYGRETRPDGTPAPAAHRAADPAANPFR